MTQPTSPFFDRLLTQNRQRGTSKTLGIPGFFYPNAGAVVGHPQLPVPALTELQSLIAQLKAPARPAAAGAPLHTLLAVVLDKSGSMRTGCAQTMKGYNEQLATARANAAQIGCRTFQVTFNESNQLLASDVPAEKIIPLSDETYQPDGGTALYDTVVATIKHLLSHPLAQDDNTSIFMTLTTDGDDQSSTVWKTSEMVEFKSLMQAVNANDRWTVALAGPDIKLVQFAKEMCVDAGNVAAFKPQSAASRGVAMTSGTQSMGNYMNMRSMGGKKSAVLYANTEAGAFASAIMKADPTV